MLRPILLQAAGEARARKVAAKGVHLADHVPIDFGVTGRLIKAREEQDRLVLRRLSMKGMWTRHRIKHVHTMVGEQCPWCGAQTED
eukprot:7824789-Alexandrium_andersonii.AAC.1